jgi:hypothetical protein
MKALFASALFTLLVWQAQLHAQSLEDLLRPKGTATVLSTGSADDAWKSVVEAFRANDMPKAVEQGNKFLAANFKASALQLLGVKVMLGLADGASLGSTFENRQDQEAYKKLEEERANITRRYNELYAVIRENDAVINEITMDRKRPVQEGSSNYLQCMECSRKIGAATKEVESLKEPIEQNKRSLAELQKGANAKLKPMTLQLLDGLIDAGEIDAAIAISNTYIRKIGNDLEVAMKQQDIVRLAEASEKAVKIINLLKAEAGPLISRKSYWEAKDKVRSFVARVEAESPDKDLVRMVKTKIALDPLGLDRHLAAAQRSYDLIRAQAELDSGQAMQQLVTFKRDYPDHPQANELELFVSSAKVKSADALLEKMEADFAELKKRFDPEKLRLYLGRQSNNSERTNSLFGDKSSRRSGEQVLAELGLAPSDERLVKSSLQGLSAGLTVLEKTALPDDRKIRLTTIKTSVDSLLSILQ